MSERFSVTRVDPPCYENHVEIEINPSELNARKNSRTVPVLPSEARSRKFSLAQLTRFVLVFKVI